MAGKSIDAVTGEPVLSCAFPGQTRDRNRDNRATDPHFDGTPFGVSSLVSPATRAGRGPTGQTNQTIRLVDVRQVRPLSATGDRDCEGSATPRARRTAKDRLRSHVPP
jgi:hypothetical protein